MSSNKPIKSIKTTITTPKKSISTTSKTTKVASTKSQKPEPKEQEYKGDLSDLTEMVENLELDKNLTKILYIESEEKSGDTHLFKAHNIKNTFLQLVDFIDNKEGEDVLDDILDYNNNKVDTDYLKEFIKTSTEEEEYIEIFNSLKEEKEINQGITENVMKNYYGFPFEDTIIDDNYIFNNKYIINEEGEEIIKEIAYNKKNHYRGFWAIFINKVLKQVHPNTYISCVAVSVVNDILTDIVKKLLRETRNLIEIGIENNEETSSNKNKDSGHEQIYEPKSFISSCLYIANKEQNKVKQTKLQLPNEIKEKLGSVFDERIVIKLNTIIAAIRLIFPGELAKHAVNKISKVVAKFNSYSEDILNKYEYEDQERDNISAHAGFNFSIKKVADFCCDQQYFDLTIQVVVAITTVLEYISAEILELAGNASIDDRYGMIKSRHLYLAIGNDEELNKLLNNAIIPYSGVLPHIHSYLLPKKNKSRKFDELGEETQENPNKRKFTPKKLNRKFTLDDFYKSVQNTIIGNDGLSIRIIDPVSLTYFCTLEKGEEDVEFDTENELGYCSVDQESKCNRCNKETAKLRQLPIKTILAKCEAILKQLDLIYEDGEPVTDKIISDFIKEQSDYHLKNTITLEEADNISLREIRTEQRSTDLIINPNIFEMLVREITKDFNNEVDFSDEAIEALQIASEDHLIQLFDNSTLEGIHRGSVIVQPKDIQISRHIKKERA